MKIALVTDVVYPFTIGGSETRNYEVAKRLVKQGYEVHILGAKLWEGSPRIEMEGIHIFGAYPYERLYQKNGRRSLLRPPILSFYLFLELLKNDFDVVDVTAFTFFSCYAAKLASWIKGFVLVITWQQYFGDYLLGYFGHLIGSAAALLEHFSTRLINHHVAVSYFVKSELIKRNVKEKNITVIYNGADIDCINRIAKPEKKYDAIYVGRLNYQKNLGLLITSASILAKTVPDFKMAIVGDGPEREKLEQSVKKSGLAENFDFLGEVKDKKKVFSLMKSAKLFVLPSLLEGFPLTIIEANACGLPVITTKTEHNNTGEYIVNKENGMLSPANPKDFAAAIFLALANPDLREKMLKAGIKKAQLFDWGILANKQEQYYQSLA